MRPIKLVDDKYNSLENFKEQMFALFPWGDYRGELRMYRDRVSVCQPGSASFDPENPGVDSFSSWQCLDELIENKGCCGTFHTHPPGVDDFSSTDWRTYRGLARANGKKVLYHGIQACGSEASRWIAMCMIKGNVLVFNLGLHFIYINSDYVSLPYINVEGDVLGKKDVTLIDMQGTGKYDYDISS